MNRKKTVGDVMTRDVFAVAPDTSLDAAAELLTRHHITGAPVVDHNGVVVGVVTLTDLLDPSHKTSEREGHNAFYMITDGWASNVDDDIEYASGRVEDVMSEGAITTTTDLEVTAAARILLRHSIHRVVVVDRDGHLVGIASSMDLLRGFVEIEDDAVS